MRGVELWQEAEETLKVRRRRTPRGAILPLLAIAAWIAVIVFIGPGALYGMIVLGVGAGVLPFVLPVIGRALRRTEITLSRSPQTVLLDLQPLEAARVETRVLSTWISQSPTGYALSLWVLFTDGGSRDVELGRFRTLLEASEVAGTIEAFLALASIKSKPASTVR